jgi:hypothetical protein
MRLFRGLLLLITGAFGGFMGAAALMKRVLPSRGDEDSDEVALVAIFDGVALKSRSQAFRGGSALSWYGGIALDLREATLAPGARLSVHSLFGGIAVRVPTGWRVESNANVLGGGVAVDAPEPDAPDAPTLVIDGFALCGGIAIGAKAADAAFEDA